MSTYTYVHTFQILRFCIQLVVHLDFPDKKYVFENADTEVSSVFFYFNFTLLPSALYEYISLRLFGIEKKEWYWLN